MINKSVKLRSGKLSTVRPGHPWVYKRQLLKTDPTIKPGSLVSVIASNGAFAGTGYYNPHSDITVRILTFKDETVDAGFIKARIAAAVAKRSEVLNKTNAYRAVFSEADGLPGLIVDVYGDTAVFQALTLGIERFKETVVDAIDEIVKPKFIYERSDSDYRKQEGLEPKAGWWGDQGDRFVEISEGGTRFIVDIMAGHKTGFYLDQRNSRLALAPMAKGKDLLDIFCYTGAFAVHAVRAGARSVVGVDIKEDWLELARKNAELNNVAGRTEFIKSNGFAFLKKCRESGRTFDIVIVDPPSFAKSKHSVAGASRGYAELNRAALGCLRSGGILATFSCSHNMPNDRFSGIVKKAVADSGKRSTILKRCHQAEDHPIVRAIPETEYLKGYFLKIEDSKAHA